MVDVALDDRTSSKVLVIYLKRVFEVFVYIIFVQWGLVHASGYWKFIGRLGMLVSCLHYKPVMVRHISIVWSNAELNNSSFSGPEVHILHYSVLQHTWTKELKYFLQDSKNSSGNCLIDNIFPHLKPLLLLKPSGC